MILLTGGSGNLGGNIVKSGISNLLTPSSSELDITNKDSVEAYFKNNEIDVIIHCAAVATLAAAKKDPLLAARVNMGGTANLVEECLKLETQGKPIRFLYVSSDGVYQSTEGGYKEDGQTIPYAVYGWTKLGGECAVRLLKNHCIIRTSFFFPDKINFVDAPNDVYTSKIPVSELVTAIKLLLNHSFIGVINVGSIKISNYDLYKTFLPNLKPTTSEEIERNFGVKLNKDASMDISLWEKIKSEN